MLNARQNAIIDLINKEEIETQDELQKRLLEFGFTVTQATISRDIKKLRLIKIAGERGKYRYSLPGDGAVGTKAHNIFSSSIVSIENAMNDVVIKCRSGMASAVCATLDEKNIDLIVGTVAGDDTILIITKSESKAEKLCKIIDELTKQD